MATKPSPVIRRIAITCGEPAGIGPDIVLKAALQNYECELVVIGDPELLQARATALGLSIELLAFNPVANAAPHRAGCLNVYPTPLAQPCIAGQLSPANASYVINTLQLAVDGCMSGLFSAMVTAPVQKSIINDAGIPFSGHTEFLAQATGTEQVVMMLATDTLRVALATTHLPLAAVPAAITQALLQTTLRIIHRDLGTKFSIAHPCIAVLGLNPHAGEGGHLGSEEIEQIIPALEALRKEGMNLIGPLPADTAFNPDVLAKADVVFAMYHDQGLPVLKYAGFGKAVNITLGLPIVRTSVDHGTALDLAGSGKAKADSLLHAIEMAVQMCS